MAIKSFADMDSFLINEISNSFKKERNFELLRQKYPFLDYNVLYSALYSTGKYRNELYNCLHQYEINDKKILLISDTHYGSIRENINYTYNAINYAIANGIHTVLHGGDILEGTLKPKRGFTVFNQANHFIKRYPSDKNITTYAILGNHDYNAINEDKKVMDLLSSRNDINILGFKKAYLKWCKNIISLQHEIENFKLNLPVYAECLSFKGHSHYYHVREKKYGKNERVYIPAMCDDFVNLTTLPNLRNKIVELKPGFLVAETDNKNIVVIYYSFNDRKIVKENEFQKVLAK